MRYGKASLIAAIALLTLLAYYHHSLEVESKQDTCSQYNCSGEPLTTEQAVMWSAVIWSRVQDGVAHVRCDGAECLAAQKYIKQLGGRVLAVNRCSVDWSPEG